MPGLKYVAVILLGFVLLGGCKKITVTTTVHPDGSLDRAVLVSGDSTGTGSSGFPIPADDSWLVTTTVDSTDSSKIWWSFTRHYENVSKLNADFGGHGEKLLITSTSEFNKKFRWFFTYYFFEETIQPLGPMFIFPDSAARFSYDAKRDSLEDIEKWEDELIFEGFFQTILHQARDYPEWGISESDVMKKRGELIAATEEMDIVEENFVSDMLQLCYRTFKNEAVYFWKPAVEEFWSKVALYLDYLERSIGEDYVYVIKMPGQIIDTNAEEVKKESLTWSVGNEDFEFDPYRMFAESRKMNVLPFVLSFVVIIAGSLVWIKRIDWSIFNLRKNFSAPPFLLNKWVSVALLVLGIVLLAYGALLIVTLWNFKIFGASVISWTDKSLFLVITLIGMVMTIIGGTQLWFRRRF